MECFGRDGSWRLGVEDMSPRRWVVKRERMEVKLQLGSVCRRVCVCVCVCHRHRAPSRGKLEGQLEGCYDTGEHALTHW